MPGDLEIFSVLARSIDECISGDLRHIVIVPGQSVKMFEQFSTANRDIVAQEDILPLNLYKLPTSLKYLAFLSKGFRRPIYLDRRLRAVRGWIIQQLLKIEITRQASVRAVMHIDSDVFFFRDLHHEDAFADGKPHFFGVSGGEQNPVRDQWTENAAKMLGIDIPDGFDRHYVENCVLWSCDVVRAMVERIEEMQNRPFYEALINAETMSEYHIYGMFADCLLGTESLYPNSASFCNSIWPSGPQDDYVSQLRARMDPKHRAISIQSTHDFSIAQRVELYEQARMFED